MAPKTPKTRIEKIDRIVPCIITHEERAKFVNELLRNIREGTALTDEAKAIAKDFKLCIDTRSSEIHRIEPILASGIEHRTLACEKVYDYDNARVFTRRPDTGAIIDDRKMTVAEGQMVALEVLPPTTPDDEPQAPAKPKSKED